MGRTGGWKDRLRLKRGSTHTVNERRGVVEVSGGKGQVGRQSETGDEEEGSGERSLSLYSLFSLCLKRPPLLPHTPLLPLLLLSAPLSHVGCRLTAAWSRQMLLQEELRFCCRSSALHSQTVSRLILTTIEAIEESGGGGAGEKSGLSTNQCLI